jgi:hypothetical protein
MGFKTTNTIAKYLKPKKKNWYIPWQWYLPTCLSRLTQETYTLDWVHFQTLLHKHKQAIRTNKANSKYDEHIPDIQHFYGPTGTLKILHTAKEGKYMNTLEKIQFIILICMASKWMKHIRTSLTPSMIYEYTLKIFNCSPPYTVFNH